jgi:16S rRNA (uracil1498-N3)-methyltransferase
MRRIRIYHPGDLSTGLTVLLETNTSHHLLQVLRKKAGERFWIFNGNGGEFEALLVSANKKTACIEIGTFHERNTESALSIHLGQAISRGERMDYAIQKGTELGATEITPLITEFCQIQLAENRIDKKIAHWQSIANSAAEQSGRCAVPIIHPPIMWNDWLSHQNELKIICCPRQKEKSILSADITPKNISVAIGAEGGFSDREVASAFDNHFIALPLGPRILRTETATVVALTLLQTRFGDL